MSNRPIWNHALYGRREALQIGAASILGLGTNHLFALRDAQAALGPKPTAKAKSCIFIFLSGGLAQHESFDCKSANTCQNSQASATFGLSADH